MKALNANYLLTWICLMILFASACTKQSETVNTISNNNAPYYDEVPTVLIENYVNRLFIDLIAREPSDIEMQAEVEALRVADLSPTARTTLITKLQTDTTFVAGDGSYQQAYYHWVYELAKAHLIEGASIAEINTILGPIESAIVNLAAGGEEGTEEYNRLLEQVSKLNLLITAETDYQQGIINIQQLFTRMIDNAVYDQINMNAFNFINASFDNLFFRFPTQYEFENAYSMVGEQETGTMFGIAGSDKNAYINIITNSHEFYEGIIIWTYQTLLIRKPTSQETSFLLQDFIVDKDFQKLQLFIMVTDEYANL